MNTIQDNIKTLEDLVSLAEDISVNIKSMQDKIRSYTNIFMYTMSIALGFLTISTSILFSNYNDILIENQTLFISSLTAILSITAIFLFQYLDLRSKEKRKIRDERKILEELFDRIYEYRTKIVIFNDPVFETMIDLRLKRVKFFT